MPLNLPSAPKVPATRAAIAEFVSEHIAPCSPRTIEAWGLTYRRLNGRAVADWADVIAFLQKRFGTAPAPSAAASSVLTDPGTRAAT
mgnify:CR=1 FL=1